MNIKSLRYFHAVAHHKSFTRAANELHIAQSAISMAIKRLEEELSLKLFHRQDKKVILTDEGLRLQKHAAKILHAVSDAELEMQELTGLTRGEVKVGIPNMLGSYYFPPLLMGFRHQYPELQVTVVEGGTEEIKQKLEKGDLDIGIIVAESLPASLEARTFLQEQMLVCVSNEHPFASQESVSYQQFFDEELVLFKEGYFHRRVTDRIAKQNKLSAKIGFETNLILLIQAIVRQGYGISALLNRAIEGAEGLVGIPFEQPVILDLGIAWRKDSYLSKANQAFVDFLLENATSGEQ